MEAKFGVGGFPPAFYLTDYRLSRYGKTREGVFPWLQSIGLDWLELECVHGVRMPVEQAKRYREASERYGIELSIHAPYYCHLGSDNHDTAKRSVSDIIRAIDLAIIIGSGRIVFHPGYPSSDGKEKTMERLVSSLLSIESYVPEGILLYPETGGKVSSIGSVDDIIGICKRVPFTRPCIDLAHVHARTLGSIRTVDDVTSIFTTIETSLGRNVLDTTHYHVYPVAYGQKGERHHLQAMDDTTLMDLFTGACLQYGVSPTVICESSGDQEQGALLMKNNYNEKLE